MKGVRRSEDERAEVIKLCRLGRTQASVARRLGIPARTVSGWMDGIKVVHWPPLNRPLKWEIVDRK